MEQIYIKSDFQLAQKFENHIQSKGIRYSFIAQKSDLSPSLIAKICKGKATITEKNRQKINEVLETNF